MSDSKRRLSDDLRSRRAWLLLALGASMALSAVVLIYALMATGVVNAGGVASRDGEHVFAHEVVTSNPGQALQALGGMLTQGGDLFDGSEAFKLEIYATERIPDGGGGFNLFPHAYSHTVITARAGDVISDVGRQLMGRDVDIQGNHEFWVLVFITPVAP
ncbi:hypothetical protein VRRI112168_02860 [Vreelandella rituensis]|uniref:Uncharacterized protein n=1 Tax=Vreelandella rituensis TaxID=2282306 RepID=A0A368U9Q6_9GAMM|nr:hypothetical protein [Halomonas rituensis]RCV93685.1 hypothetical protein DU506_00580 [Halomonas rituensis]